ncbi:MAG: hypothetical protein ACO1Q7_05715 [Gemmatimonas sp.]
MSDRNWEQELAKIDKQLASVSDEQLLAQSAPTRAPLAAPGAKAAPAPKASASVASSASGRPWMAWVQLTIAIAAGVGLWFWPWNTRCGLNAISFTAATGAVGLLGLWSAIGSWRHRQGAAHVLSFFVMIWALVLGAREVLPRVGYAIPTAERTAGWGCQAPAIPANVPAGTPSATPSGTPSTNPSTTPGGEPSMSVPPSTVPNGSAPAGANPTGAPPGQGA